MRWWETSVGGAVRGQIIGLLRRQERSVDELAGELGVTDNAIRAQLQSLEREGVVHAARIRRSGTVGKPATMYAINPEAEALFSAAYAPVLGALLASLSERMTGRQLDALFRDVGRRLAAATMAEEAGDAWEPVEGQNASKVGSDQLETRVKAAAAVLTALGAEIDIARDERTYTLQGHACPLSQAVRIEPRMCHAIEELVAGLTGATVRECCANTPEPSEGRGPRCCFEIRPSEKGPGTTPVISGKDT